MIKVLLLNVSVQNVHGVDVTMKLSIAREGNDNNYDEDGYNDFHSPDDIDVPPFEHNGRGVFVSCDKNVLSVAL